MRQRKWMKEETQKMPFKWRTNLKSNKRENVVALRVMWEWFGDANIVNIWSNAGNIFGYLPY